MVLAVLAGWGVVVLVVLVMMVVVLLRDSRGLMVPLLRTAVPV